jgi:hypothetical protein
MGLFRRRASVERIPDEDELIAQLQEAFRLLDEFKKHLLESRRVAACTRLSITRARRRNQSRQKEDVRGEN